MLKSRKKIIIVLAIVAAAAAIGGYLLWFVLSNIFDATDYEKITLHYHASDLTVDTDLSADEQEIIAEAIGKQISWDDGSLCGFSEYATLTFVPSDGNNTPQTYMIGMDECGILKNTETAKELALRTEGYQTLQNILLKYGVKLPLWAYLKEPTADGDQATEDGIRTDNNSDGNQTSGDNAPTTSASDSTPASSESPTSPAVSQMRIECAPQMYMITMSSTPGIRIHPVCAGAGRFVYTSDTGTLFTWIDSIVSDRKTTLTLPAETPAYWSPDNGNNAIVTITALDKDGKVIATGEVKIRKGGDAYTPVESENVTVAH